MKWTAPPMRRVRASQRITVKQWLGFVHLGPWGWRDDSPYKRSRNESRHQVYEMLLRQFFLGQSGRKTWSSLHSFSSSGSRKECGFFRTVLWFILNHASQNNSNTQPFQVITLSARTCAIYLMGTHSSNL